MKDYTDAELVLLARAGDDAAFATLVRRHQGIVRGWLQKLDTGSNADDIAQETFIQAWKKLKDYEQRGEFRSWLLSIAYRAFLQSRRRHKRETELLRREEVLAVKEQASHNQAVPDLERLLAVLNPQERACMLLCYSHGYSHGEIVRVLAMPLGTVKSHIRRSLIKIRQHFQIEVEDE